MRIQLTYETGIWTTLNFFSKAKRKNTYISNVVLPSEKEKIHTYQTLFYLG